MHDLVIRNGLVVDGTGAPARQADVAIDDGVVAAIGEVNDLGREEIDADGLLVTPGFVDIHTHFDGQITWDPLLTPSFWHGVTTVVMGNCGVGFAPAAPNRRDWLIGLMEGVEDIPGSALAEGMEWGWESFPEYLDFLDKLPKAIDIGTQVPHGAVRAYVMGDRGARNEDANPEDIQEMSAIVKEGLEAGALGFSTSRTLAHRAIDGEPVPGTFAAEDELFGIGQALKELGTGIYEVAPAGVTGDDANAPELEIAWMRKLSAEIERPVSFAMVQFDNEPDAWRDALDRSLEALEDGAELYPQVAARGISILLTLRGRHPFIHAASYRELDDLDWEQRSEAMRDPATPREDPQRGRGPGRSARFHHVGQAVSDDRSAQLRADSGPVGRGAVGSRRPDGARVRLRLPQPGGWSERPLRARSSTTPTATSTRHAR